MEKMDKTVNKVKQYLTAKMVVSITLAGGILPLIKVIYWTFETAYLASFGISPEVFNRPVFSSNFISVWLFTTSILPAFIFWLALILIGFLMLTFSNFEQYETIPSTKNSKKNIESIEHINKKTKLEKFRYHLKDFFLRLFNAAIDSIYIPFLFLVIGLLILITSLGLFLWANKEGRSLGETQLNNYIHKNICLDSFNNSNEGCFTIEGIEGDDHFVIINNKTHLIYTSKKTTPKKDEGSIINNTKTKLHIIEKEPNQALKISRTYKTKNSRSTNKK